MEATGVYWSALYSRLMEAGIDVTLVQPRDVRRLNRPKSDIADCQMVERHQRRVVGIKRRNT